MAWVVPHALEDAVLAAARAQLGDAPLATGPLVRAIVDRSRRYTSERERGAADPIGDLAARAAFFTIADALKIAVPLGELAQRGALPAARPLRLVDLGAGCGAMALGALATLRGTGDAPAAAGPLEVVAIDRDAAALAIARGAFTALAQAWGQGGRLTTTVDDLARAPVPRAELVVIGSALNELAPATRLAVVERALAALVDDGALIVIEPALRDTARALHELRDAVLTRGRGHVVLPCTRAESPCPALAAPEDWCHEDRPLRLPPRTAELARLTHLRDGGMKFSYLVLRRAPLASPPAAAPGGHAWRIVGAPRPAKGKLELLGCGAAGWVPLRRLRRHRADVNRALDEAVRGDVLHIAAPVEEGRVEIASETPVTRWAVAAADDA